MHIRYDEAAHAGAEHLDVDYVAAYERKARFDPGHDLAVLRKHGFAADSTLLEFGAATGTFAIAAGAECRRVIAVDPSPAMIAALHANVDASGLANIECVAAGFLSYQHSDEPVDVVYTRHALHHLPDFWKAVALDRVARLLPPGGVLYVRDLVYSFAPSDAAEAVRDWVTKGTSNPDEGWTPEELETHVLTEHSTFTWLFEPMLEHVGFDIVEARYQHRFYAEYVCAKRDPSEARLRRASPATPRRPPRG
jgi:ubiquinone/menaquinone biosynthesis C-methylase UbiE